MGSRVSLEAALRPLAARMAGAVREHEVLRIAATVHGKDTEKAAGDARREVLAWAQNRCGGRLPREAWECESFEYLAGGRNSLGVRLRTDDADIWGIRAEDPDKQVAGRIWTTEVIIGAFAGQRARFSTRQLVSTSEEKFGKLLPLLLPLSAILQLYVSAVILRQRAILWLGSQASGFIQGQPQTFGPLPTS